MNVFNYVSNLDIFSSAAIVCRETSSFNMKVYKLAYHLLEVYYNSKCKFSHFYSIQSKKTLTRTKTANPSFGIYAMNFVFLSLVLTPTLSVPVGEAN